MPCRVVLAAAFLLSSSVSAQEVIVELPPNDASEARRDADFGSPTLVWGEHRLEFGLQLRFRWTENVSEGTRAFEMRRGRFSMEGSFAEDRFRLRFAVEMHPRSLEIIDALATLRVGRERWLNAGVAKVPFTLHWWRSSRENPFVDWPITTPYFGGGRQLGIWLQWPLGGDFHLDGGLFTGHALRTGSGQEFARIYGERVPHYASLRNYTPLDAPHPEAIARFHWSNEEQGVAVSAAYDFRAVYAHESTLRLAIDAFCRLQGLELWSAAFLSLGERQDGSQGVAIGGLLIGGRIPLGGMLDIALRYAAVIRSEALLVDVEAHLGDQPIFEVEAAVRALHEVTASLSVYAFGHDAKLILDASLLRNSRDGSGGRLRAQLQLGF